MDINKLKNSIEILKDNAGMGLLSVDIYADFDGMSIAGYNSNPKASALFNRVFSQLINSLKSSGFPTNLEYYFLMLGDKKCVIVGKISGTNYMYGMLANLKQLQFGLLMNVIIPEFLENLEKAIK